MKLTLVLVLVLSMVACSSAMTDHDLLQQRRIAADNIKQIADDLDRIQHQIGRSIVEKGDSVDTMVNLHEEFKKGLLPAVDSLLGAEEVFKELSKRVDKNSLKELKGAIQNIVRCMANSLYTYALTLKRVKITTVVGPHSNYHYMGK